MKKKWIICVITVLMFGSLAAGNLAADVQYDIGLNVPVLMGIKTTEGDAQEVLDYVFVIPDLKVHYFWDADPFRIGVGARAFTVILETLFYPMVTAEIDINMFRLTGSFGGGLFVFFGLWNSIETSSVFIPELTAAYMVNDWFHLGLGTSFILAGNNDVFKDTMPYVVYGFGRFSLGGKK